MSFDKFIRFKKSNKGAPNYKFQTSLNLQYDTLCRLFGEPQFHDGQSFEWTLENDDGELACIFNTSKNDVIIASSKEHIILFLQCYIALIMKNKIKE